MLNVRMLFERDGVALSDVACGHRQGCATEVEEAEAHAVVFVRRGCFVRRSDGREHVLDPTLAYCTKPGEEQRYDHPHGDGDECTTVSLSPEAAASLWGGDPALPDQPVPTSPRMDVQHRLLLSAGYRGVDPHELFERSLGLAADALGTIDLRRAAAGLSGSSRSRRALADGAREALAERPDRSLPELARALSISPHHLSRVFRAVTGHTISRHRMRLRARAALERLSAGETDLARLAADLGFADQSHLCRVVREETGQTPSVLRAALQVPEAASAGQRCVGDQHAGASA